MYATLLAYGRLGYREMLVRQVRFARSIAAFIEEHSAFELLPSTMPRSTARNIFMIVLFKAKDAALNDELVKRINATSRMYVSGTSWLGRPASRIAVSNWQIDEERDIKVVRGVLEEVACDWAPRT